VPELVCQYGALKLEFISDRSAGGESESSIRITGVMDVPNPNYTYTLSLQESVKDKLLYGALKIALRTESKDLMGSAVITPLEIDETFIVTHQANGLMIDISKNFNWGPEFFLTKFHKKRSLCIVGDLYK